MMLDHDPEISSRTRYHVDLRRYHSRHEHGDLTVFLTWAGPQAMPAMVIVPARKLGHEDCPVCIVRLEGLWIYSEEIGDPQQAAIETLRFARFLGIDSGSAMGPMRVLSIIRDHLGDIAMIPPRPRDNSRVVAEAIKVDHATGQETSLEITDDG